MLLKAKELVLNVFLFFNVAPRKYEITHVTHIAFLLDITTLGPESALGPTTHN